MSGRMLVTGMTLLDCRSGDHNAAQLNSRRPILPTHLLSYAPSSPRYGQHLWEKPTVIWW
jgi:hypothetical protein